VRIEDVEIGQWVVYRPHHGPAEDGEVTAVRGNLVMVRYVGDQGSKATYASDLEPGMTP
jgi:hypothetical protein